MSFQFAEALLTIISRFFCSIRNCSNVAESICDTIEKSIELAVGSIDKRLSPMGMLMLAPSRPTFLERGKKYKKKKLKKKQNKKGSDTYPETIGDPCSDITVSPIFG